MRKICSSQAYNNYYDRCTIYVYGTLVKYDDKIKL